MLYLCSNTHVTAYDVTIRMQMLKIETCSRNVHVACEEGGGGGNSGGCTYADDASVLERDSSAALASRHSFPVLLQS